MEEKTCKFVNKKIVYEGKDVNFVFKDFEIKEGEKSKIITYEYLEYKNNDKNNKNYPAYKLSILALNPKTKKILVKSIFRYAVNKLSLEFPIIDIKTENENNKNENENENENNKKFFDIIIETIDDYLKSIKIEGKFKKFLTSKKFTNIEDQIKIGSNCYYDPWKSDNRSIPCMIELNENVEKSPENEPENFVEYFLVDLSELLQFITDKINNENYCCCSELYNFAYGMHLKNILKEKKLI